MKYPVIILCLMFLIPSSLFAGETFDRWLRFAASSREHRKQHEHLFYKDLEQGTFDQNELLVFIRDRVFFFEYFEERLKAFINLSDLPDQMRYRSQQYRVEADVILRLWQKVGTPSQAARDYVAHLQMQSDDTVLFHYLVHLGGESFGAQVMAKQIQKKTGFEELGNGIRDLGQDLRGRRSAREQFHAFAGRVFPDTAVGELRAAGERMSDEYVTSQVRLVFMYSSAMFDLAHEAKVPVEESKEKEPSGGWFQNTFLISTPFSW